MVKGGNQLEINMYVYNNRVLKYIIIEKFMVQIFSNKNVQMEDKYMKCLQLLVIGEI